MMTNVYGKRANFSVFRNRRKIVKLVIKLNKTTKFTEESNQVLRACDMPPHACVALSGLANEKC